jgi:hypothetical protein
MNDTWFHLFFNPLPSLTNFVNRLWFRPPIFKGIVSYFLNVTPRHTLKYNHMLSIDILTSVKILSPHQSGHLEFALLVSSHAPTYELVFLCLYTHCLV